MKVRMSCGFAPGTPRTSSDVRDSLRLSETASSYPSKLGLSDTLSSLMLHGARSDLMRGTISGHRGGDPTQSGAIMAHQVYSAGP